MQNGCVVLFSMLQYDWVCFVFVRRRRHTRYISVIAVQTCALPICRGASIVTQPLEAAGHSTWEERLARAGLLLREIGLPPEAATRFPAQLSGGQRQRVN